MHPAELNVPGSAHPVTAQSVKEPFSSVNTKTHTHTLLQNAEVRGDGLIGVLVRRLHHPPTDLSPMFTPPTSMPSLPPPTRPPPSPLPQWCRWRSDLKPGVMNDSRLADASSPKCVGVGMCMCVWTTARPALLLPFSGYCLKLLHTNQDLREIEELEFTSVIKLQLSDTLHY